MIFSSPHSDKLPPQKKDAVHVALTYYVSGLDVLVHNSCVYDVGLAKDLRADPLEGTEVNHAPQSRQADSLVGDWNNVNNIGNEPAIRLPKEEHDAVSAAQAARSEIPAGARDLLADEIGNLRNNTGAPNSALKQLINLNKELHPYDYAPLHRI